MPRLHSSVRLLAKSLLCYFILLTLGSLSHAQEAKSEGLTLSAPNNLQVVQRDSKERGTIFLTGSWRTLPNQEAPDRIEARISGTAWDGTLVNLDWTALPCDIRLPDFSLPLLAPAGGWYVVQVRTMRGEEQLATVTVQHVGVGEVFVVAGQSNSANHGEVRQKVQTDKVVSGNGSTWQVANDPQPGASGDGGSFIPPLGDALVKKFGVPVGFVPCGIGATSVREWLPKGTPLTKLPTITGNVITVGPSQWEPKGEIFRQFVARQQPLVASGGFRAVLWHQGESDANQKDQTRTLPGETYMLHLNQLMHDSRQATRWPAPWFVAQVSYHSAADPRSEEIRDAQKKTWDQKLVFAGPDSDTLLNQMRDTNGQGIHFSDAGLKAHAALWEEKLTPWLEETLTRQK